MITPGESYKLILEAPDGKIFEAHVLAATINQHAPYSWDLFDIGPRETEIEVTFIATNNATWSFRDDWKKSINTRKAATEWKCDYCGRPNQHHDETCKSCGAVRSFVYGDL